MILKYPILFFVIWGFFGHQWINRHAVYLLPPEMGIFFKKNIEFLTTHAVDPDNRRYMIPEEGPRHYIDIDKYGTPPFDSLPRSWNMAVEKYGLDTLKAHGIVPWWVQVMLRRLTLAFREKNESRILKIAAELGHYIGDAHVPLHACSNHNGQFTGQKGIHGLWESRIPEIFAEKEWDYWIGKPVYLENPGQFIWDRVLESAVASDSVLKLEKELTDTFPPDGKFAFEERKGVLVRQYSTDFARSYDRLMNGMVERRMRASIHAVASFWYTAWVDGGCWKFDF